MKKILYKVDEGGDGLLLEDVLREAASRGREAFRVVIDHIRGVQSVDIMNVLSSGSDLKMQYSDDDGESWNPERRMRSIFPEDVKNDEILGRLAGMKDGEEIFVAMHVPQEVVDVMTSYVKSGHLKVENSDQHDSTVLKVTCLKEGGRYLPIAADSVVGIDYRLRGIGDIAKEMGEACPDHELTYQNIGNVSQFVDHPPFMVKVELDKRFPGLSDKLSYNSKVHHDEWQDYYDHALPSYPPTGGVPEFTEYVLKEAKYRADCSSVEHVLEKDDIIPTCGAAHAIQCLRTVIAGKRRFLHVLPSYPVQTDTELAHAKLVDPEAKLIGSDLKPNKKWNVWMPDLDDIETKLKDPENNVGVISIIHPSNPTGHVWKPAELRKLFALAKEAGVVVESDETYWQILAPGSNYISAGAMASEMGVPVVVYRSSSKDALKCGEKFGWAEFYNFKEDPRLAEIKKGFFNLQQEAVGATAIQRIMPSIYEDDEYVEFITDLNEKIFATAGVIKECFDGIDGVSCITPEGAMYTSIVFDEGVLNRGQKMDIDDDKLREYVGQKLDSQNYPLDEQFLIYLMAQTGVVASPLSGFRGSNLGFRVCNFEFDLKIVKETYTQVADAVKEYLGRGV